MKKILSFLFIAISFISTNSCQSQNQESAKNKDRSSEISYIISSEAKYNNISFKYPSNWFFEKEVVEGIPRMSTTPNALKDIKMLRAFEIIELKPNGWTFTDFKSNFVNTISNRGTSKAVLIKRETTKFKNYEAVYAEIIQDPKTSSIPTKAYGINTGKYVYLITMLGRSKDDQIEPNMESINDEILKSLIL